MLGGSGDVVTDNPFEVLAEQVRADELSGLPQYGPVGRLRFIVWSVGLLALSLLLFVALLTFAGGLGMLALPLLFIAWAGGQFWLVRARLRNAGLRQLWWLLPAILLLASYPALLFTNAANAPVITSILSQFTSLLALLNLPILLICATLPTAFADREKRDLPGILLPAIGGAVAVIAVVALLLGLLFGLI